MNCECGGTLDLMWLSGDPGTLCNKCGKDKVEYENYYRETNTSCEDCLIYDNDYDRCKYLYKHGIEKDDYSPDLKCPLRLKNGGGIIIELTRD